MVRARFARRLRRRATPIARAAPGANFRISTGQRRAPISLCGRNAVQIHERSRPVDLAELASRLARWPTCASNEFALRAAIDPYELTVFPDGRAIIKGTTDTGMARSVYARYVGM